MKKLHLEVDRRHAGCITATAVVVSHIWQNRDPILCALIVDRRGL
jgi:hypothetical protein